ncbi:MAG: L-erythro-3,5-diaminohexanoate dehydrogenase [Candidatus Eremiobacterota bacterium]
MPRGCPYGSHRSLDPVGSLPQAAWKLDNTPRPWDNEILVDVDTLNIDSASFTQMEQASGHNPDAVAGLIAGTIQDRGKMHNPVTGSGGMFLGTVAEVGPELKRPELKPGVRLASLVSLSLTPLHLDEIHEVRIGTDQVRVKARAILFESGIYAVLPEDLAEEVALAVLDVAGAPAQTARLARPGDVVMVVGGGGKSGLLCCCEARRRVGPTGTVLALDASDASETLLRELGVDQVLVLDASRPLEVLKAVTAATGGRPVDLAINCVNLPGTEMSTILPLRPRGMAYFFSMATSFTAATLGAEGAGKDVDLMMGNGYAAGHDRIALQLLRENAALRRHFEQRFAAPAHR